MGLLYGSAGRLTAENGGFRTGQWDRGTAPARSSYGSSLDGSLGRGPGRSSIERLSMSSQGSFDAASSQNSDSEYPLGEDTEAATPRVVTDF